MYSAYKLNKQGDNIKAWGTPFQFGTSLLSMSSSNWCFLTYIQISQDAGKVVSYFHIFKNFQFLMIHTVQGFSVVNEALLNYFI